MFDESSLSVFCDRCESFLLFCGGSSLIEIKVGPTSDVSD